MAKENLKGYFRLAMVPTKDQIEEAIKVKNYLSEIDMSFATHKEQIEAFMAETNADVSKIKELV